MEIKRHKDQNGLLHLTFSGRITIQEAGTLRQELVTSFQDEEALNLNLSGVNEMDLTCFQLLCSAHRTALATNKRIFLDGQMGDDIPALVKTVGLERSRGCSTCDDPSNCLWARGES